MPLWKKLKPYLQQPIKQQEKTETKPTALSAVEPIAETITIDDFAKLDMRGKSIVRSIARI